MGFSEGTGMRVSCIFCLKFFSPIIVRVACDVPIVRVAHGWGGGVEA